MTFLLSKIISEISVSNLPTISKIFTLSKICLKIIIILLFTQIIVTSNKFSDPFLSQFLPLETAL